MSRLDHPDRLALDIGGWPIDDCLCGHNLWVKTAHREIVCNCCRITYRLPVIVEPHSPCCHADATPFTHYESKCDHCGRLYLRRRPQAMAVLLGDARQLNRGRCHAYDAAVERYGATIMLEIYGARP